MSKTKLDRSVARTVQALSPMKAIALMMLTALTACESGYTTNQPVMTTSAKIEPRRREPVPPSPPPVMGQMPNSATPLPEISNDTGLVDTTNPPPGTSTTITVPSTGNKRDERIEKKLRSELAADSTLTPEGKNVEIMVKDRKVVLKGQVRTERERMDIDNKARATDDVIDVDDQIQVVP